MDHPILEQLRADHVNVGRVMRVAIHELEQLAEGGEADYAMLEDALRYITGYSDVHHHPVEDVVYDELSRQSPEAAEAVEQIVEQHGQLISQGQTFLQQVEAVEEEAIMRRDRFVESGLGYLNALGRHMGFEEKTLFPLAADTLSAESWARIEARFEQAPDPLFGPHVAQEYRHLLTRIHA